MRKMKKTGSKKKISENNNNQVLETFISMKSHAECNENIPAISFGRFHEDFCTSTNISSNLQNPFEAWKGAKHSPETYISGNRKKHDLT